jgi:hypothetical protein
MSEARDKFYELLAPAIEAKGYVFKKSKKQFVLTNGEAICTINFSWDGRGGTTYLNHINGEISFIYLSKALITVNNLKGYPIFYKGTSGGHFDETIPQMYSKELFALTRDMAFKKMSAMSFEEKYPLVNIQRTVDRVKEIIETEIIPIHQEMSNEKKILNLKINNLLEKLNEIDTDIIMWDILIIKIMSKKMKLEEPKFIKDIKIFTNKSIDPSWNMQLFEFDKMEEKFNNLKF